MGELKNASMVFPVILYDGEREMHVGNLKIHHALNFKNFQMMLKEITGISYNNLTTYFVDTNKSKIVENLITGKVNFSALIRKRNCYFLVVLKRSRRRKPNNQSGGAFAPVVYPEYLFRMRRGFVNFIGEQMPRVYGRHGYDVMRQNYMNAFQFWNYSPLIATFPMPPYSTVQGGRNVAFCEDCTEAEKQGKKAEFHCCVNDEVVSGGFRSSVGPISRPN